MKLIKYKYLSHEINHGTEEEPNIEQILCDEEVRCAEESFEVNYAIAQRVAVGEITVEDIPDEDTPPSQLDQLEAQVTYTAMMTDTLLEV